MKMTISEVDAFIADGLPGYINSGMSIESIADGEVVVRQRYSEDQLRPGGSLSGPTMMTLADTAMYALVLAQLGPLAMAVTQQLSINFLKRPEPADILAKATFLRLGRRLAVMEVRILSTHQVLVAHATGTYALPEAHTR